MDLTFGIYVPILLIVAFSSGINSSQLYLQPTKQEHGFFTNDSFFITCFTTDETIEQLTWLDMDTKEITATEGRIHVQPADGIQQGLRLVVANVEKQDAGRYTCSDVHDSVTFDLIVYKSISFSDTPKVQNSPEGGTAVVVCNVKSDPKPVVNWYFNGSKIVDSQKYEISDQHSLRIHNLSRSDAGDYKCKAFVITPLSSQVNELDINLHVQYSPEVLPDQEHIFYASLGALANLTCSVSGDPVPMFQWVREGSLLYNSSDYMIFNTANRSVLQMTVRDMDQLGQYVCQAGNELGEKEVTIELKEGDAPLPPELSVANEDQGIVRLNLKAQVNNQEDDLKVTGFKVEYILATETWDMATIQEFNFGEAYHLKNMSYNSDYILRAAAHNAAGYSDYSQEVAYKTHSLQVAQVISNGALGMLSSSSVLLISILLFRMF